MNWILGLIVIVWVGVTILYGGSALGNIIGWAALLSLVVRLTRRPSKSRLGSRERQEVFSLLRRAKDQIRGGDFAGAKAALEECVPLAKALDPGDVGDASILRDIVAEARALEAKFSGSGSADEAKSCSALAAALVGDHLSPPEAVKLEPEVLGATAARADGGVAGPKSARWSLQWLALWFWTPVRDGENWVQTIVRVSGNLLRISLTILVALAGVIAIDIYLRSARNTDQQELVRGLEVYVNAPIEGQSGTGCEAGLLGLTVVNNTSMTLMKMDVAITARHRGQSTNLLGYGNTVQWDFIVPPQHAAIRCYSIPSGRSNSGYYDDDGNWRPLAGNDLIAFSAAPVAYSVELRPTEPWMLSETVARPLGSGATPAVNATSAPPRPSPEEIAAERDRRRASRVTTPAP